MTPPSTTSVSVVTNWQLAPQAPSNVLTWHLATSQQLMESKLCKFGKSFVFLLLGGGGYFQFKKKYNMIFNTLTTSYELSEMFEV